MKRFKIIATIFLALFCLTALLPTVLATDDYALGIIGETKSTSKGDTITYEIKASQKGRIYPASIRLTWEYDTSVFTLVDKKLGNLYYDKFEEYFPCTLTDTSYEGFIYSEAKEGILVTLTFKVNANCNADTYPIKIHAEYYNDERITTNPMFTLYPEISTKYNCYSVMAENGSLTVNDHIYGAWTSMGADTHQRECTLCHNTESAPHHWDQGEIKKAASCISEGLKVYSCLDCGETKDEILPKTKDHVYGDWTYAGNAEKHQRSCECGDTQYEEHNLGDIQKHDANNHKRVCECGYEVYSAHSFGAYQKHDADNHKQVCVCGEPTYSAHTWDEGKVTKPAQHLEEGIRTHTCTVCKDTKEEAIPKTTTHNYGIWQTHDESQHKRSCKCGEWNYADHEWNTGAVTKPATNTEDGVYTYTCTVCGATKNETIPRFEGSVGLSFRENDDGTWSVSGIGDCTDTNIVIPTATPDGAKVTGIRRNAFKDNNTITSVTIPVGITTIEKWAFRYCKNLKSVTLPGGLTEIGEAAFQGCTSLTSVTIPSGMTEIQKSVFSDCTSLTNVTLPNGLLTIGASTFSRCTALTNIKIPATVKTIGDSAFFNCLKLTSVAIPPGVTVIEKNTFYGCSALKTLTLSEGLTEIGTSAFQSCGALTAVAIPNSVTTIGDSAFYACEDMKTLTFGNGLKTIGTSAFESCEGLTSVILSNSLETLGSSAFAYCSALKNVTISENLKTLGSSAFAGCRRLTRVILPKGMTSVGTNVWTGCTDLSEIYYLGTPPELTAMAMELPESAKVYYYAETKPEISDGNDYWHYENGEIVLWVLYIRGDMNGDGVKNAADAIYLLRYTVMSNFYPLNQPGDLNGDGFTNAADAIYLLRNTVMPNLYPLK
ncbi:MAG: leucine-rich repeat protein [Clostridia bacterium]|nr:leucine-rich repeat protein [Clostridia bacterium]